MFLPSHFLTSNHKNENRSVKLKFNRILALLVEDAVKISAYLSDLVAVSTVVADQHLLVFESGMIGRHAFASKFKSRNPECT